MKKKKKNKGDPDLRGGFKESKPSRVPLKGLGSHLSKGLNESIASDSSSLSESKKKSRFMKALKGC